MLLPVMAFAEVTVQCEQFPGKHFYNTNRAVLTIRSTEPIVIFISRYRMEDQVESLPSGGVYVQRDIFRSTGASGKYVIKDKNNGLKTVPYTCQTLN